MTNYISNLLQTTRHEAPPPAQQVAAPVAQAVPDNILITKVLDVLTQNASIQSLAPLVQALSQDTQHAHAHPFTALLAARSMAELDHVDVHELHTLVPPHQTTNPSNPQLNGPGTSWKPFAHALNQLDKHFLAPNPLVDDADTVLRGHHPQDLSRLRVVSAAVLKYFSENGQPALLRLKPATLHRLQTLFDVEPTAHDNADSPDIELARSVCNTAIEDRNNIVNQLVRNPGNFFARDASDSQYTSHLEIMREVVGRNGLRLEAASPELQDNFDIVLAAVTQNGEALEHASDRLKKDPALQLAALARDAQREWAPPTGLMIGFGG